MERSSKADRRPCRTIKDWTSPFTLLKHQGKAFVPQVRMDFLIWRSGEAPPPPHSKYALLGIYWGVSTRTLPGETSSRLPVSRTCFGHRTRLMTMGEDMGIHSAVFAELRLSSWPIPLHHGWSQLHHCLTPYTPPYTRRPHFETLKLLHIFRCDIPDVLGISSMTSESYTLISTLVSASMASNS